MPCAKKKIGKEEIEKLAVDEAKAVHKDESLQGMFIDSFIKVHTKIMKSTVDGTALLNNEIAKLEKRKNSILDLIISNHALDEDLNPKVAPLTPISKRKRSILKTMRVIWDPYPSRRRT